MSSDETILRTILAVIAVIVLLPVLMMVFLMPMMGFWGGGHMWNGGMWNGTGVGWMWLLMWVVLLAVLLGGGYLVFRGIGGGMGAGADPALEELRTAYARGELSDEEFEERRERLLREQ